MRFVNRTPARGAWLYIAGILLSASVFCCADSLSIDVVVHDKHGRPIRDLQPNEIQILQDGTPAKVEALHLEPTSESSARYVSLLFDGKSESGEQFARSALTEISKQLRGSDVYFSVWQVQNRLQLLQGFTQDNRALQTAIHEARRGVQPPSIRASAAAEESSSAAATPRHDATAETVRSILERSEQNMRERSAHPLLAALLALAREEKSLPGRKTVVFFSDGVQIGTLTADQMQLVAAEAARAHVSFYTVDLSGVSLSGQNNAAEMMEHGMTMGGGSFALASNPSDMLAMASGKDEKFKGKNQTSQMKALASETGGAYESASHSLGTFFRNIARDAQTYYQIAYSPTTHRYDGHLMPLSVKVERPHTRVQSPSDFFDLPPGGEGGTEPFELPLLKELDKKEKVETIWFDGAVVRLGQQGGKTQSDLLVQVPLSGLVAHEDDVNKTFSMHVSFLALILDSDQQVIRKLSENVQLRGALEQLSAARKDVYTFQKPFAIVPGEYHVDIAIEDQNAAKLSAKTIPVAIPRWREPFGLSDLVVVRRLETESGPERTGDLLQYRGMRIVPDIGVRQIPAADAQHPVFFEIFSDPRTSAKPQVHVELRRGAVSVASVPVSIPEAKPGQPIPVLATFHHSVAPGEYELYATVTQGGLSRQAQVKLRVQEDLSEADVSGASLLEEKGSEETSFQKYASAPPLIPNAPKPSDAEIASMLSGARARVSDYKRTLPNFLCTRVSKRFVDSSGHGEWRLNDSYVNLLRYVGGKETTALLEVDGRRASDWQSESGGAVVTGEFGELLDMVFSEKAKADIQWRGAAELGGARTQVFQFQVARRNSFYDVIAESGGPKSVIFAAYRALVYIDANTFAVRRVSIEAQDLPKDFRIRESAVAVEYDYVPIGGNEYLLPLRSTLFVRQGARYLRRNEIEYQNYRKYGSQSSIKVAH